MILSRWVERPKSPAAFEGSSVNYRPRNGMGIDVRRVGGKRVSSGETRVHRERGIG